MNLQMLPSCQILHLLNYKFDVPLEIGSSFRVKRASFERQFIQYFGHMRFFKKKALKINFPSMEKFFVYAISRRLRIIPEYF